MKRSFLIVSAVIAGLAIPAGIGTFQASRSVDEARNELLLADVTMSVPAHQSGEFLDHSRLGKIARPATKDSSDRMITGTIAKMDGASEILHAVADMFVIGGSIITVYLTWLILLYTRRLYELETAKRAQELTQSELKRS